MTERPIVSTTGAESGQVQADRAQQAPVLRAIDPQRRLDAVARLAAELPPLPGE